MAAPVFDVVIIGAGPAGLAALSALHHPSGILADTHQESRAYDRRLKQLSVAVVDTHGEWMGEWRGKFEALQIPHLRSPAWAHPDALSRAALMEFAHRTGRESELRQLDLSGTTLKNLHELGAGLFQLPGNDLFCDFCHATAAGLNHTMIRGTVRDVNENSSGSCYELCVQDQDDNHTLIRAAHVVFALGPAGGPNVPEPFESLLACSSRVLHTSSWRELRATSLGPHDSVLVIGGGQSAAQAALLAARKGAGKVLLCSRRPLVQRHYDLSLDWMNHRTLSGMHARLFEFYGTALSERAAWIKRERAGATVPSTYVRQLHRQQRLNLVVDTVCAVTDSQQGLRVTFNHGTEPFDATRVVLATGTALNCAELPLMRAVAERFQLPVVSGLPVLDDSLQWGDERFSVVGALATLQVGPDAANLTGCRRAAEMCADALGVYDAFYEQGKPLANIYDLIASDSESTDDD